MSTELIALDTNTKTAFEMGIAKQAGDELERHYPGWMWFIEVKGGVVEIRSGYMDFKHGFRVKITKEYYSASQLAKEIVRAGGEMLERTNMPRSRYDHDKQKSANNKNLLQSLTFQS